MLTFHAGAATVISQQLVSDTLPLDTWLLTHLLAADASLSCQVAALKLLGSLMAPQHKLGLPMPSFASFFHMPTADVADIEKPGDIATGVDAPASVLSSTSNVGANSAAAADAAGASPTPDTIAGGSDSQAAPHTEQAATDGQADAKAAQLQLLQNLLSALSTVLQAVIHCSSKSATPESSSERVGQDTAQPQANADTTVTDSRSKPEKDDVQATAVVRAVAIDGEALHAVLRLLLHAASTTGAQGLAALFAFPNSLLSILPQLLRTPQVCFWFSLLCPCMFPKCHAFADGRLKGFCCQVAPLLSYIFKVRTM